MKLLLIILLLITPNLAKAWKMEVGEFNVQSTFNNPKVATQVVFQQAYPSPPVVSVLTSTQGGDRTVLRITNVTTTGFYVWMAEDPTHDGEHVGMSNIPYIAIEPGVHEFSDCTKIAAGFNNVSSYVARNGTSTGYTNTSYGTTFANTPVVITDIQTMDNETQLTALSYPTDMPNSNPFMSPLANNIGNSSVDLTMEMSGTNQTPTGAEQFGFIAIEQGNFNVNNGSGTNIEIDSFYTGATAVDGWNQNCDTITFPNINNNSSVALATKVSRNENDGGWLRRCGNPGSNNIQLNIEEDRVTSNRDNNGEQAALLVFDKSFALDTPGGSGTDIQIAKTVDNNTPNEGDSITYNVDVTNNGPCSITNFQLIDNLPSGTSYSGNTKTTGNVTAP